MEYILSKAQISDLDSIINLIGQRIDWMDQVGIKQWNTTDYFGVYPRSHFESYINRGIMYVARLTENGPVLGVEALLPADPRWPDGDIVNAWYVHHLATSLEEKGLGREMIRLTEELGRAVGLERIRLDCDIKNVFLNTYYQSQGYEMCGQCVDGAYSGNLREKIL